MKKMMTAMLMILLLAMPFTGCSPKDEAPADEPIPMTDEEETSAEGQVFFSELKYDQNEGTLHCVIQNDSDVTISVGGDIFLEIRAVDGLWADVMPLQWNGGGVINGPIIRIYQIGPGESFQDDLDVAGTFGELRDGEYRISMQIGTERGQMTISGGFTVSPMK